MPAPSPIHPPQGEKGWQMKYYRTTSERRRILRKITEEAVRFQNALYKYDAELRDCGRETAPMTSRNLAALKRASSDLSVLLPLIRGTRKEGR